MFVHYDTKRGKTDWKGYTLVMPCISIGNVGQLAADLIISTLYMSKAGYLYDDSIVPVIGNNPFATGDPSKVCQLMTAAEVFENPHHELIVVQLRSSLVPGKKEQFLSLLQQWIDGCGFCRVVVLTSSLAHERTDCQLQGSQLRYVQSGDFTKSEAATFIKDTLKWQELEQRPLHPAYRNSSGGDGTHDEGATEGKRRKEEPDECSALFIPGGGFAKHLFKNCISSGVPALILSRFCSEGDNIYDAVELASMLNSWLSWVDLQKPSQQVSGHSSGWKMPSSWTLQYGSGFQQILFQ